MRPKISSAKDVDSASGGNSELGIAITLAPAAAAE
jgi:hypothetical protein